MNNGKLEIADANGLSRLKWEYEQERSNKSDLLCFGTADMDYRSPQPVLDALQEVLQRGHLGYYYIPESYYKAMREWLIQMSSWDIDTYCCSTQVPGVYVGAWYALQVMTDPGDKIAILTPVHFCFKKLITLNNRTVIECPLLFSNNDYHIDFDSLEACLCSGVKMIWICNPHNPMGKAWSKEELKRIADLCMHYHVYILSDDVYAPLTFKGTSYTAIASLSREISEYTVTLYSVSKGYNTASLRSAFIITENPILYKKLREQLDRMGMDYGKNIMGIVATEVAFKDCESWRKSLMKELQENYVYVKKRFQEETKGCRVCNSNASYFAWIDLRSLRVPPKRLTYDIEENAHIIVENGCFLGKGGAGFIRFNFAADRKVLEEGIDRLIAFCKMHEK